MSKKVKRWPDINSFQCTKRKPLNHRFINYYRDGSMHKQALLLKNTKLFKSARKRMRELASSDPTEDDITVEFANALRSLSLENKLNGIWVHVPNEVSDNTNKVFGMNLLAKGKIPGMADFIVIRKDKGILIELKTLKGKMSENQKHVQKWCEEQEIVYRIARSCAEGLSIIKEEGFLSYPEFPDSSLN